MSDDQQNTVDAQDSGDNAADVLSAIAMVVLPVVAIVYWLSGLPTS